MVDEHDVDPPFDLFALGEALVDLISTTVTASLSEALTFDRFLGGQVEHVRAVRADAEPVDVTEVGQRLVELDRRRGDSPRG